MVKMSVMTKVIALLPDDTADPNSGSISANSAADPKNPQKNRACPSRMIVGIARGPYSTKAGPNINAADRTKNAIASS